jgi:hypothetical protein
MVLSFGVLPRLAMLISAPLDSAAPKSIAGCSSTLPRPAPSGHAPSRRPGPFPFVTSLLFPSEASSEYKALLPPPCSAGLPCKQSSSSTSSRSASLHARHQQRAPAACYPFSADLELLPRRTSPASPRTGAGLPFVSVSRLNSPLAR